MIVKYLSAERVSLGIHFNLIDCVWIEYFRVRYEMKKQSKPKAAEKPSNTEQTEVVEDRKFMIKLRLPLIEASLEKTVLASGNPILC